MSLNRYDAIDRDPTPYARCARRPRDIYVPTGDKNDPAWLWSGTQRAPAHPDEKDAITVIETTCGGRVRIYEIQGDSTHRRVVHESDWRPPA